MAKIVTPLTNIQVKQAQSKEKEYNLSDGGGLFLRVKPNGTKSWIFNYTSPVTGKRSNLSFGVYPDLSLADAREHRAESKRLLANNIDSYLAVTIYPFAESRVKASTIDGK
jgi:hypothetical protein